MKPMKSCINYSIVILSFIFSTPSWSVCIDSSDSVAQLQILGSGGPGASGGRASASYLLWVDGVGQIMVDAGSGIKDQFYRAGADIKDIQLLALSHLHPDHSVELPGILWPAGGSFSVAGPSGAGVFPPIDEFLDRLFGQHGAYPILADRIELNAIIVDAAGPGPVEVWYEGDTVVRGVGVPHGDVPTIAYRIDVNDSSIVFASDQTGSDPTFRDFIAEVDVLVVHMSSTEDATGVIADLHAKPSVWGQMAEAAGVGHVVISHLSSSSRANEPFSSQVLSASVAILRDNYSGPVTVGDDLLCIEVK
jgi:ribonuclease BN (tRNA processing enzyme)